MLVPRGGQRTYTPDNATREFLSDTVAQRQTSGANLTGFVITHSDGSKDTYGFVPAEHLDGNQVALLTASADPFGHTTSYLYQETNSTVFLKYVVDTDGRTNSLTYTNSSFPNRITGVTDPFGRSIILRYDAAGMLTNVVDVAGLPSSFRYDSSSWLTNLTTPYGQTVFQHTVDTMVPDSGYAYPTNPFTLLRAVKVIDAAAGTNVYMLRQDSTLVFTNAADFTNVAAFNNDYANGNFDVFQNDGSYLSAFAPTVPGLVADYWYFYYRLSLHWGPKQAAGLPLDVTTFHRADFMKARMQHWLHDADHLEHQPNFGVYPRCQSGRNQCRSRHCLRLRWRGRRAGSRGNQFPARHRSAGGPGRHYSLFMVSPGSVGSSHQHR